VDEKGWKGLKNKLPETHEWMCSFAVKKKMGQGEVSIIYKYIISKKLISKKNGEGVN